MNDTNDELITEENIDSGVLYVDGLVTRITYESDLVTR